MGSSGIEVISDETIEQDGVRERTAQELELETEEMKEALAKYFKAPCRRCGDIKQPHFAFSKSKWAPENVQMAFVKGQWSPDFISKYMYHILILCGPCAATLHSKPRRKRGKATPTCLRSLFSLGSALRNSGDADNGVGLTKRAYVLQDNWLMHITNAAELEVEAARLSAIYWGKLAAIKRHRKVDPTDSMTSEQLLAHVRQLAAVAPTQTQAGAPEEQAAEDRKRLIRERADALSKERFRQ